MNYETSVTRNRRIMFVVLGIVILAARPTPFAVERPFVQTGAENPVGIEV